MAKSFSKFSRRCFLAGTAGIIASPLVLRSAAAVAKSHSVTFCAGGGSFQDNLVKYVLNPFTEETGIKVNFVPITDMAKVKAQILTGNIEWDIFDSEATTAALGSKSGFWEKLDPSLFDLSDLVVSPASDYVIFEFFAAGVTWDPKKFGPGKHPSNFAELFDVNRFPGRRALRNSALGTLEAALLSDGVAPKDIYPLDLDRAFKVLERIKSSVVSWTPTAAQTVSLVQTGEVDFSWTYPNRVKATTEPGGGAPLAFSFEQNLLFPEALAVLKGAPNKENAMKLIGYMVRPEVQLRLENQLGLTPVSKKAANMLSSDARKWQPDASNPKNLVISGEYWADHGTAVETRYKEWLLH
ncbi:putative spermidine/putrescine transport system substrate-binding protein [Bradyrhizobium japonicum]